MRGVAFSVREAHFDAVPAGGADVPRRVGQDVAAPEVADGSSHPSRASPHRQRCPRGSRGREPRPARGIAMEDASLTDHSAREGFRPGGAMIRRGPTVRRRALRQTDQQEECGEHGSHFIRFNSVQDRVEQAGWQPKVESPCSWLRHEVAFCESGRASASARGVEASRNPASVMVN
jgi:hypothetical protein